MNVVSGQWPLQTGWRIYCKLTGFDIVILIIIGEYAMPYACAAVMTTPGPMNMRVSRCLTVLIVVAHPTPA